MGPLKGIKIIEFSGIGPGPFCGMLLADLGADVIRISRPEQRGQHNKFDIHNRSKRTIVADLKNPETILEIHKLISQVDAVFEGFRPGVMERLDLGPETCFPLNKALVYGRMTGWGQDGDMSLQAGHDINYIGLSGALNSIGRSDSNPAPPLNLIGDYGGGGMHLAVGMLSALISSLKTGEGQVVDSSMVDGSLALMSFFYSLNNMGLWKDQRESNLLDGAAHFYDTYKCSDGKFIAIGSIEPQFYKILLEKLGINDLRFNDQMNKKLWPEFKKIISSRVLSKTRDEWMGVFSDSDACVTPVLDMEESKNHHHNVSRNAFVEIDGFNQPAPSPRFSETPLNIKHNASEIGVDIAEVCSEFNLNKELFI